MNPDFENIVKHFTFEGEFTGAFPYGSGHINDTYAASFSRGNGESSRYILQRINHRVFKEPEKLMKNIEGVTKHLRNKIVSAGGDPERETLNIVPTTEGESFHKAEDGSCWRGYLFIENAHTYDVVENREHFYNGGRAFGRFQKLLEDFPAEQLYETIPDFHNTKKRFNAFVGALDEDPANRAGSVKAEIDFALRRADDASVLLDLLERGRLSLRVTHNDSKFNNVMIDDASGEGICVIDLDTVMPGLALYDFGDSIRSGANPASEDEKDLSKVWMELDLFEYFTHGYLDSARDFLTSAELEYLPLAAKIMTFECGIRFLTDFLKGTSTSRCTAPGTTLTGRVPSLRWLRIWKRNMNR